MNYLMKRKIKKIFFCYIPLVICTIVTLFPFYWFIVTSLKSNSDIMQLPLQYIPNPLTLENYTNILDGVQFLRYFANGLIVSFSTTLIIILISILGGYAVSRYKFKGKSAFMLFMLLTQMVPGVVILIPLFQVFNNLGLINNLWSLIIVNTTVNLPFCLIVLSGFFSTLPPTLEEAAQIDGCSLKRAIFTIVVPAILPGVVSSGAFAFVNSWNEFVYALNFINDSKKYTVPVGLSMMQGEFTVNYGGLAAGTIIAIIPVILVFCYIQKYLVSGLSAGAVKG